MYMLMWCIKEYIDNHPEEYRRWLANKRRNENDEETENKCSAVD